MSVQDEDREAGFVWQLFQQLRRRRMPLGVDDYDALRQCLLAGFGLSSREALRDLCCTLWAKSRREADLVGTLFDRLKLPEWSTREVEPAMLQVPRLPDAPAPVTSGHEGDSSQPVERVTVPEAREVRGLPPLTVSGMRWSDRPFVFVPQYPVSFREAAQTWRRLRRPVRFGPPTELDVESTVISRARRGVASPPVLVPPRRNVARLLLLVDRQGSMAPFHGFTDEICAAIEKAGGLEHVAVQYFKNLPSGGADPEPLNRMSGRLFPTLDHVLPIIQPIGLGEVYRDRGLRKIQPLGDLLAEFGTTGAVALISDAGAARRRYRPLRLLNTVAFLKALRGRLQRFVWLNPVPSEDWQGSTAAQIARHAPMFCMTRRGMHDAVNVLRGHPHRLESPL